MKRVLFVDDEQHVLDGLRDLMRRHRKRWEMHFAKDPRVAIEWMAEKPFDVVVADMRMPGMDGAALLTHIKANYASTARIILSGQADRDSVMRALPAAHQFLSKPCDPDTLNVVIERACQLRNLLSDPNIRDVVGRLDRLPSPPHTYWELTLAAARPDTGIDALADIVEQDPAMSLKVLQLVNSAYFGTAQRVISVRQAVGRLGVELLKALALTVHAFDALAAPPCASFSIEQLQQHSFSTARLARKLAGNAVRGAEAFAAAVLHDVGKLVLALGIPEQFAQVVEMQDQTDMPAFQIEQELLGMTHAEVGAYLLGSWGLPLTMVEAVAYHHIPSHATADSSSVCALVHVADALIDTKTYQTDDPARDNKLDLAFIAQAKLTYQLTKWREIAAKLEEDGG